MTTIKDIMMMMRGVRTEEDMHAVIRHLERAGLVRRVDPERIEMSDEELEQAAQVIREAWDVSKNALRPPLVFASNAGSMEGGE